MSDGPDLRIKVNRRHLSKVKTPMKVSCLHRMNRSSSQFPFHDSWTDSWGRLIDWSIVHGNRTGVRSTSAILSPAERILNHISPEISVCLQQTQHQRVSIFRKWSDPLDSTWFLPWNKFDIRVMSLKIRSWYSPRIDKFVMAAALLRIKLTLECLTLILRVTCDFVPACSRIAQVLKTAQLWNDSIRTGHKKFKCRQESQSLLNYLSL